MQFYENCKLKNFFWGSNDLKIQLKRKISTFVSNELDFFFLSHLAFISLFHFPEVNACL